MRCPKEVPMQVGAFRSCWPPCPTIVPVCLPVLMFCFSLNFHFSYFSIPFPPDHLACKAIILFLTAIIIEFVDAVLSVVLPA